MCDLMWCRTQRVNLTLETFHFNTFLTKLTPLSHPPPLVCRFLLVAQFIAPMGSPSHGGGVSRLSLPTPFSPIFVCPSAYRNLSPVLLFTHQLLPTYLQFSSSDCPFCLHRPFTYISLLYKPSFCHFSFSHTLSVPRSRKMLAFWAGRKSCIYAQR